MTGEEYRRAGSRVVANLVDPTDGIFFALDCHFLHHHLFVGVRSSYRQKMGTNTNSPQGPYIRVSDLVDVGGAVVVPIPQKDTGGTGASETGKVHTKIRMEKVEGKQLYKRDGFYFERQFREAWKGTGNVDPFEGNAYGIDVAVSAEEQTQFEKVVQEMDTDDGKEDTVDVVKEALKSCLKSGQSGNIRILLGPSENVIAMLSATKLTKIALATDLMRLFVTILAAFSESKESIWATFSVAYLVKVLEHDASCDKRTRQIVPKMLKPLYVSQLVLLVVRLMCAGIIRGMSHSELSNMLENLGRPLHDLVVKMNSYITNDLRNKEAKALYEECKNEKLNEAMDAFVEKNESSPVASAAEEKSVSDDFAASGVPGTVEICGPRSRVDATQGDTSPKGTLHPKVGEKEGNEPMEKEQQLANGSEQTSKKREGKKKKRNGKSSALPSKCCRRCAWYLLTLTLFNLSAADITQPLISSDDVLGTPLLDCNREVIHQDEDDRGYNIPSCYKLVHDDSDGTPLVFPDVDTTKSRKKLKEGLDAIS